MLWVAAPAALGRATIIGACVLTHVAIATAWLRGLRTAVPTTSEEHCALTLPLAAASLGDFTMRTSGQAGPGNGLHKPDQGGVGSDRCSPENAATNRREKAARGRTKGKLPRRRLPRGCTGFRQPAPATVRRWDSGGGRWRLLGWGRWECQIEQVTRQPAPATARRWVGGGGRWRLLG